jgi:hypothetical protein
MDNEIFREFQHLGMTVLVMNKALATKTIIPAFPSMMGMTDAQIAVLPPYVQHFHCEDSVENGDPGCIDHKYNSTICSERNGMASWHPGWKYHALEGHWLAATIIEVTSKTLVNYGAGVCAHKIVAHVFN